MNMRVRICVYAYVAYGEYFYIYLKNGTETLKVTEYL